jgi:hypothetical protein
MRPFLVVSLISIVSFFFTMSVERAAMAAPG